MMATTTRIYTVSDGNTERLVRTTHPSHALMHVATAAYTVRVATQEDLETLLPAGVKVEQAKAGESAES